MTSFFAGLSACTLGVYGAAALFRRTILPIESLLSGRERRRLEEGPVHVMASIGSARSATPLKVPIEAIHGLHHVHARSRYELAGFVASRDLPGQSAREPLREVRVNVSVWWNAPAVRKLLKQRQREEREAASLIARRSSRPLLPDG